MVSRFYTYFESERWWSDQLSLRLNFKELLQNANEKSVVETEKKEKAKGKHASI